MHNTWNGKKIWWKRAKKLTIIKIKETLSKWVKQYRKSLDKNYKRALKLIRIGNKKWLKIDQLWNYINKFDAYFWKMRN